MNNPLDAVTIQQQYYAKTASQYNEMHLDADQEHSFALGVMVGLLDHFNIKSILDIGSGTGRAISYIKRYRPDIRVVGIEPVKELREIGYSQGILQDELIDGDVTSLNFKDGEFDLVCEFAVLHHLRDPEKAVSEMLRVADKAIFISDENNFGDGSFLSRSIKQLINALHLWKVFDLIKTKGKGYSITEGDGLRYSYSVFNNYKQIKKSCRRVHMINTRDSDVNLYTTTSHVAFWAVKNKG
jgi:ubiquinone/menaquinone biosynthesis C-methylase UbiE